MPNPDSLLTRCVTARLQALGLPKPTQRLLTASFLLTLAVLQQSDAIAAVSHATAVQFASGDGAAFDLLPLDLGIEVEPFGLITCERVSLTPASQRLADLILNAPVQTQDVLPIHLGINIPQGSGGVKPPLLAAGAGV